MDLDDLIVSTYHLIDATIPTVLDGRRLRQRRPGTLSGQAGLAVRSLACRQSARAQGAQSHDRLASRPAAGQRNSHIMLFKLAIAMPR